MKWGRLAAIIVLLLAMSVGCAPRAPIAPEAPTITVGCPSTSVIVTTTVTEPMMTDGTTDATSTNDTTTSVGKTTRVTTTTRGKTTVTTTRVTSSTTTHTTAAPTAALPAVSGEVRAAWVSYIEVTELLGGCSTPAQARQAMDGLMKRLVSFKINTVFFHVRANSDAYYPSKLFKTASAVSKLVAAGFDPLGYAVEAAHREGLELHAWVNPYRVGKQTAYLVKNIPTLTDDTGRYYYVPTSKAAQALILDGIREILNNYAVDGVQYDDYFYPDGLLSENTVYAFESADYEAYRKSGGTLTVGNWRRAGVDSLIAGTHTLTAAKGVVFGVSPAANADNTYKALYADCRKWLAQEGYVDYLCPQIYTGFEHGGSPFDKMVNTWMGYERHSSVELYVGVALYKIGLKSDTYAGKGKTEWAKNDDIMKRSVLYLREKHIPGICFYSYSYFEPASKAGLSSTADVAVAQREIRNLKEVL